MWDSCSRQRKDCCRKAGAYSLVLRRRPSSSCLSGISSDFRDITFRHFDLETEFSDYLRDVLIYVENHRDAYEVFLLPSNSRYALQFREAAIDLFYYHAIKYQPKHDRTALKYKTINNYSGIAGVVEAWFHSGFAVSPDQLIQFLK